MNAEPRLQPEIFRPAASLRAVAAAIALLAVVSFLASLFLLATHPSQKALFACALFGVLTLEGAATLRRRVEVTDEGLTAHSPMGIRQLLWGDIRRVDVRRGSFVIESSVGPVSAAMVAPQERERLLRLIIDRAKLTRSAEDLPWGIEARYVPRREEIQFVPHHRRRN